MIWQIDKYQLFLCITLLKPTPELYCPCIAKFAGIILCGGIFGAIF